jgi:glycosyltransferase involved in cell wall biosynthesis
MIPVCWYEGIAGLDKYSAQFAAEGIQGRSRYACCGLLNDAFDSYGDTFQHFSGWDGMPRPRPDYAVVIVHGGHLRYQVENINSSIAELQGVLIIGIGDEESDFPYHELRHRNMKLWMQSPIPGRSRADRFPIVGYPVDCRENLVHGQERIYDFSFAGQVTHARREECVRALKTMSGGKLLETKQFYSGMPHDEYFKLLGQSKIVPCPSGPVCSDTFRLAEALEAGCIPIVDEHPGWRDQPTRGIFNMLFPQGHPFPLIGNWADAPQTIQNLLNDYENQSRIVRDWWASYKASYFSWLREDLRVLGVSI